MRGRQDPQVTLLAFIDLETRVPSDHPLRVVKRLADQALKALSPDLDRMYANVGRPSIPPERLLKSSLLIACTRCAVSGHSVSSWITTSSSGGFWI